MRVKCCTVIGLSGALLLHSELKPFDLSLLVPLVCPVMRQKHISGKTSRKDGRLVVNLGFSSTLEKTYTWWISLGMGLSQLREEVTQSKKSFHFTL